MLAQLCDRLNLSYILRSEDTSFHFKFIDVISGNAEKLLVRNPKEGIEKEK